MTSWWRKVALSLGDGSGQGSWQKRAARALSAPSVSGSSASRIAAVRGVTRDKSSWTARLVPSGTTGSSWAKRLFTSSALTAVTGAAALLAGESAGLAISFESADGLGQVAVVGHTTNLSNVPVDSFFTNLTTSPKLVLWSDGLHRWTPHNLATWSQGDMFGGVGPQWIASGGTGGAGSTANATTAPDGTMTAGRVNNDGSGGGHFAAGGYTFLAGATYAFSVYLKADQITNPSLGVQGAGNTANAVFNLTGSGSLGTTSGAEFVSSAIESAGNGWYLCTLVLKAAASAASSLLLNTGQAGAAQVGQGFFVWGTVLNYGTTRTRYLATTTVARYAVPIDYQSGFALFNEPQATNILTQSQAFNNATSWTLTGGTISADAVAAPDGTAVADTFTTTDVGPSGFSQAVGTANGGHTYSLYVKAGTATWIALIPSVGGSVVNLWSWFNIATGVVGTKEALVTSSSIQSVGNGWYRCSVTYVGTASAENVYLRVASANGALTSGAAGLTAHVWGAQLETGSLATSPIPTFAATVTRAADKVSVATSAFPMSATAGSLIATVTQKVAGAVFFVNISDGTVAERYALYNNGTFPSFFVADGGATVADLNAAAITLNTETKLAAAWAVNDFALVKDGGAPLTDSGGTLPTPTILRLGTDEAGNANILNGRISKVIYLPRRTTNADLQLRTAA